LRDRHPNSWWIWYTLLEIAFDCDDYGENAGLVHVAPGIPFSEKGLANELCLNSKRLLMPTLKTMEELGLIEIKGGIIRFLSYSDRQYISDLSTPRTRKCREKQRVEDEEGLADERSGNVPRTVITEKNKEQNKTEKKKKNTPPIPPEGEGEGDLNGKAKKGPKRNLRMNPQELVDLWNEVAPIPGMEPVEMTLGRKRKIEARLAWKDDPDFWRRVFQKAKDSPFLRGEVETFKATLDWLTKNNTIPQKVYEGAFDDKRVRGGGPPPPRPRDPKYEGLDG